MTDEKRQRRIRIVRDPDPPNPREDMDWVGTMVTWHDRYILGDAQPNQTKEDWLEQLALDVDKEWYLDWPNSPEDDEDLEPADRLRIDVYWRNVAKVLQEKVFILELHLNDHSGPEVSAGDKPFVWDTEDPDSRVDVDVDLGFIYVTRERAAKEYGIDEWTPETEQQVHDNLKAEVDVYDQYLEGDMWGFLCEELPKDGDPDCDWEEVSSCWGFFGPDPDENGMRDHWGDEWQNVEIVVED